MFVVTAQTLGGRVWEVGRTANRQQAEMWVGMVHESSDDLAHIFNAPGEDTFYASPEVDRIRY